jgi:alpha-glucosidase
VVVSAIPYDCYYFQVTDTQTEESSKTKVMVPFSPVTRIMSFSSYQKVADTVSTVPGVSGVFKHTIGDPRTYPSSQANLSNVTGAEILQGTNGDDYGSFVGVGIGNNVTEEEVDITQGQSRALENTLEVNISTWGGAGGFYAKPTVGLGYTFNSTKSSEKTSMYSGSVAGLPEGREAYSYKWGLTVYPYDLTAGDAKQRCVVVNYMCQPVGANYPPAPVKNLKVDSRSSTGIKLKWDSPVTTNVQTTGLPSGYTVYRADSEDGEYTQLATVSGRTTVTYTDTTATKNDTYYYRLTATNTRESLPVALTVPRIKVKSMALKTAPTLSYTDGAALDLSKLAVTLTFENGQTQDVSAANFGSLFLTSLTSGGALSLAQHGDPLTVTYIPDNITLSAGALSISAATTYDIGLTGSFTVGTTTNATALVAGKTVSATASLKNNTTTSQPLLVLLALYSDKGAMVASSTKTATVAAGATSSVSFTNSFTLPSTVSGYSVKLFVWDGTSITDTKQVPKSNVITLP